MPVIHAPRIVKTGVKCDLSNYALQGDNFNGKLAPHTSGPYVDTTDFITRVTSTEWSETWDSFYWPVTPLTDNCTLHLYSQNACLAIIPNYKFGRPALQGTYSIDYPSGSSEVMQGLGWSTFYTDNGSPETYLAPTELWFRARYQCSPGFRSPYPLASAPTGWTGGPWTPYDPITNQLSGFVIWMTRAYNIFISGTNHIQSVRLCVRDKFTYLQFLDQTFLGTSVQEVNIGPADDVTQCYLRNLMIHVTITGATCHVDIYVGVAAGLIDKCGSRCVTLIASEDFICQLGTTLSNFLAFAFEGNNAGTGVITSQTVTVTDWEWSPVGVVGGDDDPYDIASVTLPGSVTNYSGEEYYPSQQGSDLSCMERSEPAMLQPLDLESWILDTYTGWWSIYYGWDHVYSLGPAGRGGFIDNKVLYNCHPTLRGDYGGPLIPYIGGGGYSTPSGAGWWTDLSDNMYTPHNQDPLDPGYLSYTEGWGNFPDCWFFMVFKIESGMELSTTLNNPLLPPTDPSNTYYGLEISDFGSCGFYMRGGRVYFDFTAGYLASPPAPPGSLDITSFDCGPDSDFVGGWKRIAIRYTIVFGVGHQIDMYLGDANNPTLSRYFTTPSPIPAGTFGYQYLDHWDKWNYTWATLPNPKKSIWFAQGGWQPYDPANPKPYGTV